MRRLLKELGNNNRNQVIVSCIVVFVVGCYIMQIFGWP
jgi:hypothetical protein